MVGEKKSEWLTQIPDLSDVNEEDVNERMGVGTFTSSAPKPRLPEPEPIDWSQVDTKDSNIVGVALLALLVVLGGLVWLG